METKSEAGRRMNEGGKENIQGDGQKIKGKTITAVLPISEWHSEERLDSIHAALTAKPDNDRIRKSGGKED